MKKQGNTPPVDTWARALAWLEAHKAAWAGDWKTAREAMFWFVSYQEANLEDMKRKDIAWFFLHGLPKASVKGCKEWIRDQRTSWEEEGGEDYTSAAPYDLRGELEDFWGVKS